MIKFSSYYIFTIFFVFWILDKGENDGDPLYNTASLLDVVEKGTKTIYPSEDLLIPNQRYEKNLKILSDY